MSEVIGEFLEEQGGYYYGRIEENGHLYLLIVSPEGGGGVNMTWDKARQFCSSLELKGFDDWVMPTRYDLLKMYQNKGLFEGGTALWSSTTVEADPRHAWIQYDTGLQYENSKINATGVRAVRKVFIS